jgi:hypothetical protein
MQSTVGCSVNSCKFNDKSHRCTLQDITIGSGQNSGEARTKKETECESFVSEI